VRHDSDDHHPDRLLTSYAVISGVVAAGLLILGAFVDEQVVSAAFVLAGLVLAWGWPVLLGLPRPSTSSLVLVAGVVAMAVVDLWSDPDDGMRWLTAALAICLVLAFLHELVRTDGRARLVLSIAGAAFGLGILASGAFFRQAMTREHGDAAIIAAAGATALGLLVDFVCHRRPALAEWALPVALLLGAALGLVIGVSSSAPWNVLLVTGLVSAGVAHAMRRLVASLPAAAEPASQLAIGSSGALVAGLVPYAALWALIR